MKIKSYSELIQLKTYDERLSYLMLNGKIGDDTFGFDRFLNQKFYSSYEWKRIRNFVIERDNGCNMGLEDYPIFDKILIHHINPLTQNDIINSTDFLLNPNYLICVDLQTHNIIHYGFEYKKEIMIERKPGDTKLW